jgi:asparagine synthetase B (glutamine-hydrolysing)
MLTGLARQAIDDPSVHWRTGDGTGAALSVPDLITLLGRGTPRRFQGLIQGLGSLPPGYGLRRTAEGLAPVQLWSPASGPSWDGATPRQAAETVRTTMSAVVEQGLRGRRRVGVLLSGGFDSTLMTYLARASCETRCYVVDHIGRAGPKEQKYAALVCQRLGLPLTVVPVGPADLLRLVDRSTGYPMPLGLWAGANQMAIAETAAAEGCDLLLSGLGSDEVFVGYHKKGHAAWHFHELAEHHGVETAWARLLASAARVPSSRFYLGQCCPFTVAQLKALFPGHDPRRALAEDLLPIYRQAAERNDPGAHAAILQVEAELRTPDLLVRELNFTAGLGGLAVAYPFLHRSLLELSARMPISWLYRLGDAPDLPWRPRTRATEKYVLRLAFHDLIPREIQVRPRMTFTVPFGHWLAEASFRDAVVVKTARSPLWREIGCPPERVRETLEAPPGSDPWAAPARVWMLFALARWWENGGAERLARSAAQDSLGPMPPGHGDAPAPALVRPS